MTIEIRPPVEDELRAAMEAAEGAFGSELEDHDWERERKILPPSRALAAYDGDKAVGLAAAYAFDLSIPGGELPCAGVTWVGVLPTHRRRGILRDFMRRQLDDVHGWGEPLAALWASEASIYGRFGYGAAVPGFVAKSNPRRFVLKHEPPSNLSVRLTDSEEAYRLFPPIYDRFRTGQGGDALALGAMVEGAEARRPEGVAARREPEVLRRRRGGRERRGLHDLPGQGRVGGRLRQGRGARRRAVRHLVGGRAASSGASSTRST